MTEVKLKMSAPVRTVNIIKDTVYEESNHHQDESPQHKQDLIQLNSLCSALQQTITEFHQLHEKIFLDHKAQIVRLSIEIANKVLAKDIQERNYEIESIIAEAIKNVNTCEQITIRLNPEDLKTFQETVKSDCIQIPEKTMFVDDASVNNGECIIESNNGIFEYLILEHLSSIENALMETETQLKQT